MNLVAWDTETALSSEHCKAPPLACVSWATSGGVGLFHWTDERLRAWLADVFQRATTIGHTIHYDVAVVLNHFPELTPLAFRAYADGRILDIRLAQKLADIANGEHEHMRFMVNGRPYTLEAMAKRHLGRELDKDTWRLKYGELRELPLDLWPEGAKQYPLEDARGTLDVYREIVRKYPETGLGDLARQTRHAFALHLVTCWGIRTDVELVREVKGRAEAEHRRLGALLLEAGLLRQDPGKVTKPQQPIRDHVLRAAAVTGIPFRLTKTGLKKEKAKETFNRCEYVATDAEACEDYSAALAGIGRERDAELLQAFADYSSLSTRLTTQFPYLERGEIHTKFESLRETGRTSSGGGGDLVIAGKKKKGSYNLQNLPRGDNEGQILGERECFVPRPGFVFGDNDYGGLELCTASQMCLDQYGRSEMAKVLNQGLDVHLDFGGSLLGLTYEQALARKKEPEIKGYRQVAKPCNFGLFGGMGAERLGATAKKDYGIVKPLKFWIATREKWRNRWSESKLHFAWAKSLTGSFENPRHARIKLLRVQRWRGGMDYCTTANAPFQALGGDVAKDALFDVIRAMYDVTVGSVLYGSRVVNFVHDQIISEFPEARAHECALEQTRLMNEAARRFLPDCPAKTAPTLARRWSKGAAEIYGPDGRLVVWEHPAIADRRVAA